MPRGYRCVILVAVGLLIGATQPYERDRAKDEKPSSEQLAKQATPPALPPLIRTLTADNPDTGCESRKDNRTSDLCAQWKAADAAYDGARWGWGQLVVGGLGLLIGAATLLAATMAALYARDAAKETKRGADAAERAIDESRQTGEAQTQAYLSIVRADVHFAASAGPHGVSSFKTTLHFHNSGSTPAVNISYTCTSSIAKWIDRDKLPTIDRLTPTVFVTNIAPQTYEKVEAISFGIALRWREYTGLWKLVDRDTPFGQMPMLIIHGEVRYDSVFGKSYKSTFAFIIEGDETDLPIKIDSLPRVQGFIPTFEIA